ncbi:AAA family ATPase [Kribbella sp. NBC_00709]|uniref:AAA family ATPase n=1 Tax=Kribbella sp. NBC_00709 TaxID=2975972 RepID=UPI002E2CD270|nr:AAA family ATPase [Kribbella sp. NBC_00709]
MAVMVLIVGLPGAGKTSMARRLEEERKAVRLTPDEWMEALFQTSEVDGRRWVLESEMLWGVAARVLELGVDVILDYGCWSEEERDLFRTRAQQLGASAEIVVLDLPFEVLWERLAKRNADLPAATFRISREELAEWSAKFEVPTAAEVQRWDSHLVVTS